MGGIKMNTTDQHPERDTTRVRGRPKKGRKPNRQMNLSLPKAIHQYSSATARYCLDQLAPMLNQWDKRTEQDEDAGVTAMQFYTALVNYAVVQREALMKTFEEVA
jgi:hypothetical protein